MDVGRLIIEGDGPIGDHESYRPVAGGKALGLVRARELGFRVPLWACLTTAFADLCLSHLEPIDNAPPGAVRDSILSASFPDVFDEVIEQVWQLVSNGRGVAARSSAVIEDSASLSAAGMMNSFLNLRSLVDLADAVRKIWASRFSARMVAYCRAQGISDVESGVAVVVQRMVNARASGVMFSQRRRLATIHSTFGLSSSLLSGQITPDEYCVDYAGRVLSRRIARKGWKLVAGKESGISGLPLRKSANRSSLTARDVRFLGRAARALAAGFGNEVDVEFAFSGRKLMILQCRRVTVSPPGDPSEGRLIWDNSNIIESYSGVTTPLTFSFIRRSYGHVYRQFCEFVGVDARTLGENTALFDNMLGFFHGRVYYNLMNWYRLVALLPGFSFNKRFMEQMMGVVDEQEYTPRIGSDTPFRRLFLHLPRLIWIGVRVAVIFLTMASRMRRFIQRTRIALRKYRALDLGVLTPFELLGLRADLDSQFLMRWIEPILNDVKAMVFVGIARRIAERNELGLGTWHNRLLSGSGRIESAKLPASVGRIVSLVRRSPAACAELSNGPASTVLSRLTSTPGCDEIASLLRRHISRFGSRCPEEMKLESISLREDSTPLITVIRTLLEGDMMSDSTTGPTIDESEMRSITSRLRSGLGPVRWSLSRWVVRHARQAIQDRENQRFLRSQVYDLVRSIVREVGARWGRDGIIAEAEDIFFLELSEIEEYTRGTSTTRQLRPLIAQRKDEYKRNASVVLPRHFVTQGEANAFRFDTGNAGDGELSASTGSSARLAGTSCFPGVVDGEAIVMTRFDPETSLYGRILVARYTDPGWAVLFTQVAGIVVERGSALSHTAIIAREMGIPCVVGVDDATTRLRSGTRLRLNADEGVVEILGA